MVKKVVGFVAVVLVVGLLLASCGGGGGGGGGGSALASSGDYLSKATPPSNKATKAVFKGTPVTDSDGTGAEWLYFYTDGTFEVCMKGTIKGVTVNCVCMKGTYTGDPTKDGDIGMIITHVMEDNDGALIEQKPHIDESLSITGGETLFLDINGELVRQ